MQQNDLLKLLDLAWEDVQGIDPECIGVILVTLYKTPDDELSLQLASTVAPAVVHYALTSLVTGRTSEDIDSVRAPTLRKAI